jgi:hypothetical protein
MFGPACLETGCGNTDGYHRRSKLLDRFCGE